MLRLFFILVINLFLFVNPATFFAQDTVPQLQFCAEEQHLIDMGLVNLQDLEPTLKVDLKYSTTQNFFNEDAYGDLTKAYLYKEPAMMLVKAQRYLRKIKPGYSLIVYDAARPRKCQYKMWDVVKGTDKEKYVANPKSGSIHNFGSAVDLTIVDESGKELDMGTEFDYLGDLAQPPLEQEFLKQGKLTKQQCENRELLRKVMKKAGFRVIKEEWWHYNAFTKDETKKRYKIIE